MKTKKYFYLSLGIILALFVIGSVYLVAVYTSSEVAHLNKDTFTLSLPLLVFRWIFIGLTAVLWNPVVYFLENSKRLTPEKAEMTLGFRNKTILYLVLAELIINESLLVTAWDYINANW